MSAAATQAHPGATQCSADLSLSCDVVLFAVKQETGAVATKSTDKDATKAATHNRGKSNVPVTRRFLNLFNPFGSGSAAATTDATAGAATSNDVTATATETKDKDVAAAPAVAPSLASNGAATPASPATAGTATPATPKPVKQFTYHDFAGKMKLPQASDLVKSLKA